MKQHKLNPPSFMKAQHLASSPVSNAARLTFEVVDDEMSFGALGEEWHALVETAPATTVFQTFDWQFLWWKHFGRHESRRLHLILVRHDNRLVGIAPFFLEEITLSGFRLYRRLCLLGCGVKNTNSNGQIPWYGITDYLDIISLPEYETSIARSLVTHLRVISALYDEIELAEVPEDSVAMRVLVPEFERQNVLYTMVRLDLCPRISVPARLNDYMCGRSTRVRKSLTRAAKRFPEHTIEMVQSSDMLSRALKTLVNQHQRRWNRLGFSGIFVNKRNQTFLKDVTQHFLERGGLWFKLVCMDGQYIATRLGFSFKDRYYAYLISFDIDSPYARYGPGNALLINMVEDAIRTQRHIVDFLRGDESYKLDLTTDAIQNWQISVPNPATLRDFRVRMARLLLLCHSVIYRISNEGRLLRVQYREHGASGCLFRYLVSLGKRFSNKIRTKRRRQSNLH